MTTRAFLEKHVPWPHSLAWPGPRPPQGARGQPGMGAGQQPPPEEAGRWSQPPPASQKRSQPPPAKHVVAPAPGSPGVTIYPGQSRHQPAKKSQPGGRPAATTSLLNVEWGILLKFACVVL
ncbi:hypothetical protein [Crucivirus-278]|nr:hypothetical protein [Crucivirus-243]QMW68742.1 hypothetical protein [Crucivirus-264]QMW68762.1 hypothetical protein [Crucivirus-278]